MNQQLIFTNELYEALEQQIHGLPLSAIIVLADENTSRYAAPLAKKTGGSLFTIPAGESQKSLATAEKIWQSWLEIGLDRHALLVNVGGGMITDLGGFLAATYKRGIRYINIPTSLLAQVDAAYGGKTGVNLGHIKNAIGCFHQPEAVFFSQELLHSLPVRELESGKAEMLKHALIADESLWPELLEVMPGALPGSDLIKRSVEVKTTIVARDPYETGERKLLNFGHTIGHALESVAIDSEKPLLHGEAVLLGMLAETELAASLGLLPVEKAMQIQTGLRHLFPQLIPDQPFESWEVYLDNDKKNKGNRILFVLLTDIGAAVYDKAVDKQQVREAWLSLQTKWG
jgi:3-dehydroquinate synthase